MQTADGAVRRGDGKARSGERLPDEMWHSTLSRVRAEFREMPCLRVTEEQARAFLGLHEPVLQWVLGGLAREGFLVRTESGEYVRRADAP